MNFFENFNDIMFFIFLKKGEFEICGEQYILKFFVNMNKFLFEEKTGKQIFGVLFPQILFIYL